MARPLPGPGHRYDVAIVGAGGCGCEAAWRLARAGADVLLVSTSLDTVFAAPNERVPAEAPADSLAAELLASLPAAADGTVSSWELHGAAKYLMEALPGVHLLQSNVDGLLLEDDRAVGVETWEGVPRRARAVALCVGPFLRARLRLGEATEHAGRPGEMAYDELADDLETRGVRLVPVESEGGGDGRPGWRLRTVRIADEQLDGVRLGRPSRLYAAGACVRGPSTYADAAADGRRLADRLASDLALGSG